MEIPLNLRPKLRFLCSSLIKEKPISKNYQKYLSDDFIFGSKDNFMPSRECSVNLDKYVNILDTDFIGKGAFAREDIPKDTYLGCYLGEYVYDIVCKSFEETMYYFSTVFHNYAVNGKNATRYFNHSDDFNVSVMDVIHENDIHNGFYTNKDIKKGEQLFIDYGDGYWKKAEKYGYFKYEDDPYLNSEYLNSEYLNYEK